MTKLFENGAKKKTSYLACLHFLKYTIFELKKKKKIIGTVVSIDEQ